MGSVKCRVVKGGYCDITQNYKKGVHDGIDLVKTYGEAGYIVAHSDGVIVGVRKDVKGFIAGGSYGNYVKIKHNDGYYTLYAHIKYGTVKVKVGDTVKKGAELGFMGNTGTSYGAHLHWEVRNKSDVRIDPTPYLDKDLPEEHTTKYIVGDSVEINGVYVSSDSKEELKPLINHGKITRIVEARNPYLLNEGKIGWVNDSCIVGRYNENDLLTLVKLTIRGDFGNGDVRRERLGGRYAEVQNQVNLNYKYGTTSEDTIRIY